MISEEQTAKVYVRQYLAFLGKSLLVCCSMLLAVDFLLPVFAAMLALAISLYLFIGVYSYVLIKPVVIQDALFWITYGFFMGVTTVALNRICAAAPAISVTCQPRSLEGQYYLGRLFPAVVTVIFWVVARLIRFVRDYRQQLHETLR